MLATLKHQLRDLIGSTLDAHAAEADNLPAIRRALLQALAAHQLAYDAPEIVTIAGDNASEAEAADFTYGRLQQIAIDKPAGHPDLLAVTVRFAVVCGNDTSLYLFKRKNNRLSLVIAQEAEEYDSISGALGEFQYAISPLESEGGFFVVTKNVNPWCASNWQTIRYQTMREGALPSAPRIIMRREELVFVGNGESGWLSLSPAGFTLEFDSLDVFGKIVRPRVAAYEIKGDTARRVPPFARTPEGFLAEWFAMPWEEAAQWSDPSASKALHRFHTRMQASRTADKQFMLAEFVFEPAACRIDTGKWQIGIDATFGVDGSPASENSLRQFVTVTQYGDRFWGQSTSKKILPRCRFLEVGK